MPARIALVCGCLILALGGSARADGCYIPEKAIQKLPEIPAQRALLSFRDGRETLIVESALEGQGKRFGWVIPVPAKPDSIEAATPGTMRSLAMGIQPEIIHDVRRAAVTVTSICILALLVAVIACWCRRAERPALWTSLGTALLLLLLIAVAAPSLLAARRSALGLPEGAMVLERTRVGSYEVAVLAADDAEALYAWLKAEDLAIPGILRPAVDDYAKRGWRFVTAKLATDGSGQAVPHPLRISFKTERAVYPMKLTGLSGRALDLELYVVGDKAAAVPAMKRVFCDQFADGYSPLEHALMYAGKGRPVQGDCFRGDGSRLNLGHPGFAPALWKGCWVSKLAASIAPGQMGEDYYVSWSEPSFERQKFYSRQGAGLVGSVAGVILFTLIAGAALIAWAFRKVGSLGLLGIVAAAALAAALLAWGVKSALPQVEASTYGGKGTSAAGRLYLWEEVLRDAQSKRRPGETVRQALDRLLAEHQPANLFTGEPARHEDSPGNYTVAEKDGRLTITMYDLGGTPVTVELEERKP
jgi:hypothetical protein